MRKVNVLLSGMIAAEPEQGGLTWVVLNHLFGLRQLGHSVHFVEVVPPGALRPQGVSLAHSRNAAYFRSVVNAFGLTSSATLVAAATHETLGHSYAELVTFARSCDVMINLAGTLHEPELTSRIPVRIYVDLDPAFTQLWQEVEGINMHLDGHTHFVTVGLCLSDEDCSIPRCGRAWLTTCQPVVLDYWTHNTALLSDAFSTVANWRGYGSISHRGVHYGQKAHSLREFIDLPKRVQEEFVLALAIHPEEKADLVALEHGGWKLINPHQVAGSPQAYRNFVQTSRAEFGIAKSGYVVSGSGWFSDRSACYLAAGRPVVAQDTGFSRHLPTGKGLFRFETEDDFVAAADALRSDYQRHSREARAVAAEFFDARTVLDSLLRRVGALN